MAALDRCVRFGLFRGMHVHGEQLMDYQLVGAISGLLVGEISGIVGVISDLKTVLSWTQHWSDVGHWIVTV
jgi:hypothetical protein